MTDAPTARDIAAWLVSQLLTSPSGIINRAELRARVLVAFPAAAALPPYQRPDRLESWHSRQLYELLRDLARERIIYRERLAVVLLDRDALVSWAAAVASSNR